MQKELASETAQSELDNVRFTAFAHNTLAQFEFVCDALVKEKEKMEKQEKALEAQKRQFDSVSEELVKEKEKTKMKQKDNVTLERIVKNYARNQRKIMRKYKNRVRELKSFRGEHDSLIGAIDALTDNFNPLTGRRVFDAAGTLLWMYIVGCMQNIEQDHRKQVREWIRAAARNEGECEENEDEDKDNEEEVSEI